MVKMMPLFFIVSAFVSFFYFFSFCTVKENYNLFITISNCPFSVFSKYHRGLNVGPKDY